MLELVFLGSGNAFAQNGRYWSSFLANGRYLFDCPPTLLPHLKRLNVPPDQIETVFITHLHGDHFVGLPFLFLEYLFLTKRTADLTIVGPPGIQETMENFADRCFPQVTRPAGYHRKYVDAQAGATLRAADVSFDSFAMDHARDALKCFGYRLKIGGKALAYTGDTMLCDEVFQLAEGADVLVVDCTYDDQGGPEHMGLNDVKLLRGMLPAETKIVLTHLGGEPDITGLDGVIVARDLASYHFL